MRILQIQHWEPDFAYDSAEHCRKQGYEVGEYAFFPGAARSWHASPVWAGSWAGEGSGASAPPDPARWDAVIVYGGLMSAYDEAGHPWLADELRFIERCAGAGTPLLGICLGSQLFARMLGARVFHTEVPEFGFARITATAEGKAHPLFGRLCGGSADTVTQRGTEADGSTDSTWSFTGLEWHEDAWELPAGARRLATGEHWENQAFAYGDRMVGTQFHLEFTREHMQTAFTELRDHLPQGPACADPDATLANGAGFEAITRSMNLLLDGLAGR